ncbi:MAG: helix-turn-helix domain-containing protein [Acidimicrobiales bacterium]
MARRMSPQARDAARLLGVQVTAARRRRRWTTARLAQQANISEPTLRKVERGDPTVSLGIAFEVAVLVGVPLFNVDAARLSELTSRFEDRIALLPTRVTPVTNDGLDDNF